jgi:hypothetical protein
MTKRLSQWTPEAVEFAQKYISQGHSCEFTSRRLRAKFAGNFSFHAVKHAVQIGILKRLKDEVRDET